MSPTKRSALAPVSLSALLSLTVLTTSVLAQANQQPQPQPGSLASSLLQRADQEDMCKVLTKLQEFGANVITAEIDPLRSEGKTLADKLKSAAPDVTYQNLEGVTHEFFGLAAVLDDAKRAKQLAAAELKQALGSASVTGSSGQGLSTGPKQ